jgi:hypothetical protein
MITLSAKNFDPLGHFEIEPLLQNRDPKLLRRVSSYKTLDGGTVLVDRGHTPGDSDLIIKWFTQGQEYEEQIRDLFARQQRCVISMHPHVYEAAFRSIQNDGKETRLELIIASRLNDA